MLQPAILCSLDLTYFADERSDLRNTVPVKEQDDILGGEEEHIAAWSSTGFEETKPGSMQLQAGHGDDKQGFLTGI